MMFFDIVLKTQLKIISIFERDRVRLVVNAFQTLAGVGAKDNDIKYEEKKERLRKKPR